MTIHEIVQELRSHLLEYLVMRAGIEPKPNGKGKYKAVCTYHNDSNPSLFIDTGKNVCNCMACEFGGDIFKVAFLLEGLPTRAQNEELYYKQTLPYLCGLFNIEYSIPERFQYKKNSKKARYYEEKQSIIDVYNFIFKNREILMDVPLAKRYFSEKRYLPSSIVDRFKAGIIMDINKFKKALFQKFSKEQLIKSNVAVMSREKNEAYINPMLFNNKTLLLPIHNEWGEIVSISSRCLDPNNTSLGKYINTTNHIAFKKGHNLDNWHRAKNFDTVIVVEGPTDAMALESVGIRNYVLLHGTAFSEEQYNKIKHKRVLFMLDSEDSGYSRFLNITEKYDDRFYFIFLKHKYDPCAFIGELFKNGLSAREIKEKVMMSPELSRPEVMIERWKDFPKSTINNILRETLKESPFTQERVIKRFAQRTKRSVELVKNELEAMRTQYNVDSLYNLYRMVKSGNVHLDMTLDIRRK